MIWNCRIFWIFKHYWPYDSKYFGFIKIQNDFVSIANFICALLNAISTLQHILPIKHIGSFSSHNKPVFFYSQSFIIPLPFLLYIRKKMMLFQAQHNALLCFWCFLIFLTLLVLLIVRVFTVIYDYSRFDVIHCICEKLTEQERYVEMRNK